ncbi:unnamed protein product [Spodoptera littoralis]|uniref:Uncharacterized protein n=1 Tax=Spodoptera littoralis TaxID=7109 RepID=A0A9P0NC64_SPOLI|nr:unnamed protein product [Spodoptera littoralis]CAH1647549.1 unnamed protein product [Spodoptera littoralis]
MEPENHVFAGWSREERFCLLKVVDIDIEKIQQQIPAKSPNQIKEAIVYVINSLYASDGDPPHCSRMKLSEWRQFLTSSSADPAERRAEGAVTARMIAQLEHIPTPERTWNIDFKEVFLQMANAMEGRHVVADAAVTEVLYLMATDTVRRCNGIVPPGLKDFIYKISAGNNPEPPQAPSLLDPRATCMCSQSGYDPVYVAAGMENPVRPDRHSGRSSRRHHHQ